MCRLSGPRVLAALLLVGCAPLSPTIPFHVAETTEVLKAATFSFTAAFGGGAVAREGGGGGGMLRLRAGVGARQEVGLEGGMIISDTGEERGNGPPWTGRTTAYGAKLSWKAAPLPWLALLLGASTSFSATGSAAGGDLGLLLSTGRHLAGRVRPYGAVRALFALPTGRGQDQAGGATATLALPVGINLRVNRSVGLFAEFGGLVGWSSIGADPAATPPDTPAAHRIYGPATHGGYYGLLAATFVLERNKDSEWFLRSLQHWR